MVSEAEKTLHEYEARVDALYATTSYDELPIAQEYFAITEGGTEEDDEPGAE